MPTPGGSSFAALHSLASLRGCFVARTFPHDGAYVVGFGLLMIGTSTEDWHLYGGLVHIFEVKMTR